MIQQLPVCLCYSAEGNLEPKLEWLQHCLELDDAAVSNMVQELLALFCYNVDTDLLPTLHFCIDALGDEQESLTLVTSCLALFGYSLEKRLKL